MIRKDFLMIVGLACLFLMSMQEEFTLVTDHLPFLALGKDAEELSTSTVWTEAQDEPLEFDDTGEETAEWKERQALLPIVEANASAIVFHEVISIEPSKNSNRLLGSLWGNATNSTFQKRQKIQYGIHVIMTFYKGSYRKDRFAEILLSLKRNLRNPFVTAVHTLWEDRDPIEFVNSTELENKLVRVQLGTQPTYKDLFDYANLRLGRGAVGIVTNSDIYFDDTLECVSPVTPDRKSFNATKQHLVYALSRHPTHPCMHRTDFCDDYMGSHDAFVFALPLPPKFAAKLDFTQNNIAAENVVIWEFRHLDGYVVKNPCHTVMAYHVHCTNERHYRKGAISRGRNRIGDVDRHASVMSSRIKCGQVIY